MSGMGKTTALKGVCYHDCVHRKYPLGFCYMIFGHSAINRTMMDDLTLLEHNSSGVKPIMKLRKESKLSKIDVRVMK